MTKEEQKSVAAYEKGYKDSKAVIKNPPAFIDQLFGDGGWRPPKDNKEFYREGWEQAKKDRKK